VDAIDYLVITSNPLSRMALMRQPSRSPFVVYTTIHSSASRVVLNPKCCFCVAHIGCDSKAQVLWGLPGERLSHWSDPAR
jgi:hypothetical protein